MRNNVKPLSKTVVNYTEIEVISLEANGPVLGLNESQRILI